MHSTRRLAQILFVTAFLSMGLATSAAAEGFIVPFIGYNFGGDAGAGCQQITNCDDKRVDYGVALGAIGSIIGFEFEFGYTPNFFGETTTTSSNVLTAMGNFMIAPKIGPIQPYGLGGVGLIRTSTSGSVTSGNEGQFGYDVGGGLMAYFSKHVGIRGDVRYFHAFQVLELLNLPQLPVALNNEKLDFGRISIGAVFKF
jgi:opacity protein-like surface antigen